jgi:hypothetical protein
VLAVRPGLSPELRIALVLFVLAALVLWPVFGHCGERQRGDTAFKLTASALVGLAATDVIQTGRCIHAGTCVEVMNPVGTPIASNVPAMATLKGAGVGAVIWSSWKARKKKPVLAWSVLLSTTALQGFLVTSNARELRKVRR